VVNPGHARLANLSARCLSYRDTLVPCTGNQRFRCGPYYAKSCRARAVFADTTDSVAVPFTQLVEADPSNPGYYRRSQTRKGNLVHSFATECICSSAHDALSTHIRSEFAPDYYAGPQILKRPYRHVATFHDPLTDLPFFIGRERYYYDKTIASARIRSPWSGVVYNSDLSCVIDAWPRMLAEGWCPVEGSETLAKAMNVLNKATNTGDEPPFACPTDYSKCETRLALYATCTLDPQADCYSSLWARADSEGRSNPRMNQIDPYMDPDLSTPSLTAGTLLSYFSTVTDADWWPTAVHACNGLSSCRNPVLPATPPDLDTYKAYNELTNPAFPLTDGFSSWNGPEYVPVYTDLFLARLQNPGSSVFYLSSDIVPFYNQYSYKLSRFPPASWVTTDPYFRRPGSPNQCRGPCGGQNTVDNPTFFNGERCMTRRPCLATNFYKDAGAQFLCQIVAKALGCTVTTSDEVCTKTDFSLLGFSARGPGLCGNGEMNFTLGQCVCDNGWTIHDSLTPTCTRPVCNCTSHGRCNHTTSVCDCDAGYTGARCEALKVDLCNARGCSGHGYCDEFTGLCVCDSGPDYAYSDVACNVTTANFSCGVGTLLAGDTGNPPYCRCPVGYGGRFCEIALCPYAVSTGTRCGRGSCLIPAEGFIGSQRAPIARPRCACPTQTSGDACEYSTIVEGECREAVTGFDCATCLLDFYRTDLETPRKTGRCSCPDPFKLPYCKFTVCDDDALNKPNCNRGGNPNNECRLNSTRGAYNCTCPTSSTLVDASLYVGQYCHVLVDASKSGAQGDCVAPLTGIQSKSRVTPWVSRRPWSIESDSRVTDACCVLQPPVSAAIAAPVCSTARATPATARAITSGGTARTASATPRVSSGSARRRPRAASTRAHATREA
jgi:hypothetical protein